MDKGESILDILAINTGVIKNLTQGYLNSLLTSKRKFAEFQREGMEIEYYIAKLLGEEQWEEDELQDLLFEGLLYGKHRNVNIYQIRNCHNLKSIEKWITNICSPYGIEDIPYKKLITLRINRERKEDLVGIDTVEDIEGNLIRVRLIFGRQVQVVSSGELVDKYMFIPIEIDFVRKILIVKSKPMNYIVNEEDKPEKLMEYFSNIVIHNMGVQLEEFSENHRYALYNMCKCMVSDLFTIIPHQIYGNEIKSKISEFETSILQILNLQGLEEKKQYNNVFDIEKAIVKVLEHIALADFLFDRGIDEIFSMGINHIITYLKFNDGTNVNATVRGENYKKCIFSSEAFMGLRSSIENVKSIVEMQIAYKKRKATVRVKYNASNYEYLNMHFYSEYEMEELDNAWERYKYYERNSFEEVTAVRSRNEQAAIGEH